MKIIERKCLIANIEKNDYSLLENQIHGDNVELIIFRDYSRISTNTIISYAQW